MRSDILQAALDAHLSPIVCRVALLVADIEGEEQALRFVAAFGLEHADQGRPEPASMQTRPDRTAQDVGPETGT